MALGSLKNKAILVPAALAISAVAPWAITPLLMLGGVYPCFEGFELRVKKIAGVIEVAPEEGARYCDTACRLTTSHRRQDVRASSRHPWHVVGFRSSCGVHLPVRDPWG